MRKMRKPPKNVCNYPQTIIANSRLSSLKMEGYVMIEGSSYYVCMCGDLEHKEQISLDGTFDNYDPHDSIYKIREVYVGNTIYGDNFVTRALTLILQDMQVEMRFQPDKEPDLHPEMDLSKYDTTLSLQKMAKEFGVYQPDGDRQELANYVVWALWQQRFQAFYNYMERENCLLAEEVDTYRYGKMAYKNTDAGVSIHYAIGFKTELHYEEVSSIEYWRLIAIGVSSIVEGSDAEVPTVWHPTLFFDPKEWEEAIANVNDEACRLWEEEPANQPLTDEHVATIGSMFGFLPTTNRGDQ